MPRHVLAISLLVAALVACSETPEGSVPAPDATGDTVVADSPVATDDVATDDAGAPDVPRLDAGADVAHVDAGFDAGFDVGVDVAPDVVRVDVPADVGVDAGVDTGPDVPVDAGPPISCSACRTTLCRTSDDACQATVFCSERFRCLDRCTGSFPEDCRSACTRAWPATSQSNAFMSCLRTNCPRSCPLYP